MTGLFLITKEVIFLSGVILIIACVFIADLIAILLNRSIIRDADMMANTYVFNIRYTAFSIFFNIIMCITLITFVYFSITRSGSLDSGSITAFAILIMGFLDLGRRLFFKIEVNNNLINFQSPISRGDLIFADINKIEIMKIFGLVMADIFTNDEKVIALNNTMAGYRLFMERLKDEEGVEWVNISGAALDKSDI